MGVVLSSHTAISWEQWLEFGMEDGSVFADPMFVSVTDRQFKLKKNSPAWALGFTEIPVEKIGCYESIQRASWPIKPNLKRFREEAIVKIVSGSDRPATRTFFSVDFIDVSDVNEIGW